MRGSRRRLDATSRVRAPGEDLQDDDNNVESAALRYSSVTMVGSHLESAVLSIRSRTPLMRRKGVASHAAFRHGCREAAEIACRQIEIERSKRLG